MDGQAALRRCSGRRQRRTDTVKLTNVLYFSVSRERDEKQYW